MNTPLFLLPLLIFGLLGCSVPKEIKQERVFYRTHIENNTELQRQTIRIGSDRLFYAAAGNIMKPAIIIIHGTPGNWHQYARYMLNEQLLKDFYVVVIDRPGWGQSTLGNKKSIASFEKQATIIAELAKQLKINNQQQPVILMGHSLGASIAPRVAIDHPDSVDGLLLFAGSLNPEAGKPRWFNYMAKTAVVSWALDKGMKKANDEIFALKEELQAMAPHWEKLDTPILLVQGMKDKLVYPSNSDYAKKHFNPLTTEVIELENEGHLFPMTRRDDVVAWARCLLKKVHFTNQRCQQ